MNKIRKFLCCVMGWHKSIKIIEFDGCNCISKCAYCGERIKQDSQGKWF